MFKIIFLICKIPYNFFFAQCHKISLVSSLFITVVKINISIDVGAESNGTLKALKNILTSQTM